VKTRPDEWIEQSYPGLECVFSRLLNNSCIEQDSEWDCPSGNSQNSSDLPVIWHAPPCTVTSSFMLIGLI
jgi:hypothetical protein